MWSGVWSWTRRLLDYRMELDRNGIDFFWPMTAGRPTQLDRFWSMLIRILWPRGSPVCGLLIVHPSPVRVVLGTNSSSPPGRVWTICKKAMQLNT
jgi:hypothetical protein